MARIYFVTLAKDTPNPFRPKRRVGRRRAAEEGRQEGREEGQDPTGGEGRPRRASRTASLAPAGQAGELPQPQLGRQHALLHRQRQPATRGRSSCIFDLAAKKETSLGNVGGYEISADGKKMIVSQGRQVRHHRPAEGHRSAIGEPLNLSGMEVKLDRKAEWKQIFNECWRQMRDFFYDPDMHGVDWPAMRKKYEPLVAHVEHRADLTYVIGEMIGELNIGHAYVGGGELPEVRKVQQGLLGAELARDPKTGYFQIAKILKGANWDPDAALAARPRSASTSKDGRLHRRRQRQARRTR